MEAYAEVGSRSNGDRSKNAAEKERAAGSEKTEKERALVMLKNLELEDEKPHAGSKMEKEKNKVLQNPVPNEFPFSLESWGRQEGGESGQSKIWGRKRRKKTYRLGKEYLDYAEKNPLPPLYLRDPRFSHLFTGELEARFVAKQKAEREERENIIKKIEEFGYADVEVEVLDYDEDPLRRGGSKDGYLHGMLRLAT